MKQNIQWKKQKEVQKNMMNYRERLTIKSQVEKRYFLNKVQKCILDIF